MGPSKLSLFKFCFCSHFLFSSLYTSLAFFQLSLSARCLLLSIRNPRTCPLSLFGPPLNSHYLLEMVNPSLLSTCFSFATARPFSQPFLMKRYLFQWSLMLRWTFHLWRGKITQLSPAKLYKPNFLFSRLYLSKLKKLSFSVFYPHHRKLFFNFHLIEVFAYFSANNYFFSISHFYFSSFVSTISI